MLMSFAMVVVLPGFGLWYLRLADLHESLRSFVHNVGIMKHFGDRW